ncbi:hypothetical protein NDU88_002241 [Pleurodeles waltl]|uniref:Uncharacterized protein n=1 Tax=Pleurodeles waltl TaxID=8319 RepID=A0AAV7RAD0_PLEWA|nr:hypothetical protein NDU88_002241 [Pleurodeles waltl]
MKSYADACRHAIRSSLRLRDWVLVRKLQARKSDSRFSSRPLKITKIRRTMIMAEAGFYSVTRSGSHFKEFRSSDDEEGEPRPSAGWKTPSTDAGGSRETALLTWDGHRQADDTIEDIGQERGRSLPTRLSRMPRRLIEEL